MIYKQAIKGATLLLAMVWICLLGACRDEEIVKPIRSGINPDGSISFQIYIPGYVKPTRAGEVSIDQPIESLHLYLFDERGGFIGIVDALEETDPTEKDDQLEEGENELEDGENTNGTYRAFIPQNTNVVHFIANAPTDFQPGNMDMGYYKGLTAAEVMAPMVTSEHLYWGKSTYEDLNFRQHPVVLYRNYAKVTYELTADAENIVDIEGWTLCNLPQNTTVAPFDYTQIESDPFHFTLSDANSRYASVPNYEERMELVDGTENDLVDQPLPIFDHTMEDYGKEVYAIFKINSKVTTTEGTLTEKPLFYKIVLLQDIYNDDEENPILVSRTPFDIKRNHIYTIRFNGINPELGYEDFEEAKAGDPANNTLIDVEETLPELQSADYILRIENGTVRYIDDLETKYEVTSSTDKGTAYNVNDLQIYYSGKASNLVVEWVNDSCHYTSTDGYIPEKESLNIRTKTESDPTGNYTHIVYFQADKFNTGDNGSKHYKEGLIRIREAAGILSRFVRVYIGEPISFRPLLISSDIPAMANERLTVAFSVPNEDYLPTSLYPIEVRFGSDRIDVEKNLYLDAMKVDLVKTSYQDDILQYTSNTPATTTNGWDWMPNKAADESWKQWGYKYSYTIEEPADSGEHRITLRSVYDKQTDFSVIMEGLSTVLLNGSKKESEADVFNTRELRFKVLPQQDTLTSRRILLNDGLADTRLVTAYINKNASDTDKSITIHYTLGFFTPDGNVDTGSTADYVTPDANITSEAKVKLWIYFRKNDLTPTGDLANSTIKTDPEGNNYIEYEASSPTGTFTFDVNSNNVRNSLIFITARSYNADTQGGDTQSYTAYNITENAYPHPYGGQKTTEAAKGTLAHIYTGVNDASKSYRSASVLVSVLSNWKFNPAPSMSNSQFEYAEEFEKPYGYYGYNDDGTFSAEHEINDFYVRIDRPTGAGTDTIGIQIDGAENKLHLVDNSTQYTIVNDGRNGNPIQLTFVGTATNYCVLRFRPSDFNHACKLIFSNLNKEIYNEEEKNTLEITNTPIAVHGVKYMHWDEYQSLATENSSPSGSKFINSLNVDPEGGQQYVVRIYFPAYFSQAFSKQGSSCTFKFGTLQSTTLSGFKDKSTNTFYSPSTKYDVIEDEIIEVYSTQREYLNEANEVSNTPKEGYTEYRYVDLLLKTINEPDEKGNDNGSDETMRLSTGNDLRFYRYSVSLGNRKVYQISDVTYELAIWNGTYEYTNKDTIEKISDWVAIQQGEVTSNLNALLANLPQHENDKVRLRITYPFENNKTLDSFSFTSSGLQLLGYNNDKTSNFSDTNLTTETLLNSNNAPKVKYTITELTANNSNQFYLKLKTNGYGIAEKIKLQGENSEIRVDESAITLSTQTTLDLPYQIDKFESGNAWKNNSDRGDENGNEIFDINANVQYYGNVTGYSYAVKMNASARVSFYAPETGMELTVGTACIGDNPGGFTIYYDEDETNEINTAGAIRINGETVNNGSRENDKTQIKAGGTSTITELTYQLGASGLYHLKRYSGGEFCLYYIKLDRTRENKEIGTITWIATNSDNSGMTNATWSGTVSNNQLSVSDFAEQLHLTFSELTETTSLNLNNGDYWFFRLSDGTYTQSTTVDAGGTLTLVYLTNGAEQELKDKSTIQLTGYDEKYKYEQDITINVRPWVEMTTNQGTDRESVYVNNKWIECSPFNIGEEATITFTVNDADHVGKDVSFCAGEYLDNNYFEAVNPPTGWVDQEIYTLSNPNQGSSVTFTWKARWPATRTLFQASGTATTDVLYNGGFLTIDSRKGAQDHIYNATIHGDYTATYYNEGYVEGKTDYTQFVSQAYAEGQNVHLPSPTTPPEYRSFSHWTWVNVNGYKETRTPVTTDHTIIQDTLIYPVWDVKLPDSEETSVALTSADLATTSACKTTNSTHLMEYSENDSYILFDVIPDASGTYQFTASIATQETTRTVTLGYLAGDAYATSETKEIEEASWDTKDAKDYEWSFYLNAGQTYTFKLKTNYTNAGNSIYCINLFGITIQKSANTNYLFTGVSSYSTGTSKDNNVEDNIISSGTPNGNQIPVKAFTNQITLNVAATGTNGNNVPTISSSSNYYLSTTPTYSNGVWTLVLGVTNLVDEEITIQCEGYNNTQTASIYVMPYISASIDKSEYVGGEKLTITINVTTVGENKTVDFYLQDRGNGQYVNAGTFTSSGGNITAETNKWSVEISGLSAGTHTYTYTLEAKNLSTSSSNKIVVAPSSGKNTDCYDTSANRFDSSVSLNYTVNAIEEVVYEMYTSDGNNVTILKNDETANDNVIIYDGGNLKTKREQQNITKENEEVLNLTTVIQMGSSQYLYLNVPHKMRLSIYWYASASNTTLTLYKESTSGDKVHTFAPNEENFYGWQEVILDVGNYVLYKSGSGTREIYYLKLKTNIE